jgi:hypothetical protein
LARLESEAGGRRQVYAILTQRARNAAAAAELLRAVFGVRVEACIAQACRVHEGNLALWRAPWRRKGYARLALQVGIAA